MTAGSARHSSASCPAPEQLASYLARRLTATQRAAVEAHLLECRDCRQVLVDAAEFVALDAPGGAPEPWPIASPWARRRRRVRTVAIGLAAAAVLVLAFRVAPWLRSGREASPAGGERSSALVDATAAALSRLPPDDATGVREALRTFEVRVPASLSDLRGRSGVLRGSREAGVPQLIDPVGTRVSSVRPGFAWDPVVDAEYQVTIFDARDREVESSDWISNGHWMPSKALERGGVYVWQLGIRRGPSIIRIPAIADAPARFEVLTAEDAARVAALEARASGAPIVVGVLRVREGLLAEAEAAFAEAAAQQPPSEEAKRLLSDLRARRSATAAP